MKRVFGAKKDKEPPPSLNDASDRVLIFSNFLFMDIYIAGYYLILCINECVTYMPLIVESMHHILWLYEHLAIRKCIVKP